MHRYKAFRFCMLVGAAALLAVALFYFINYAVLLDVALSNSSLRADLAASVRALWLAFGGQALLIALLYSLVAFRPPAVSREVVVLLGLLQIFEATLLFTFAGNVWMAVALVAAAVFVLAGTVLWPQEGPLPQPPQALDATSPAAAIDAEASATARDTVPATSPVPELPPPVEPAGQDRNP
jgi:xanthosine utilization system XapX-like protein